MSDPLHCGTRYKRAAEKRFYVVDFGNLGELLAAETITGQTVAGSPSGLTITGTALLANGYQVGAWVEAGTAATDYTLTYTVTLSGGGTVARPWTLGVL